MSDRSGLQPPGSGGLQQATGLQQIDTDIQTLVKAVNRIAAILTPTPQVITGSRAGNVALANLLTGLAASGLIIDNTTP